MLTQREIDRRLIARRPPVARWTATSLCVVILFPAFAAAAIHAIIEAAHPSPLTDAGLLAQYVILAGIIANFVLQLLNRHWNRADRERHTQELQASIKAN